MKKSILIFVVAIMVIISVIVWMSTSGSLPTGELVQFGIIGALVIFSLFIAYKRITSERRGQPAEDEMTKTLLLKASATAYFISLYLWLVVMYMADKTNKPHDVMFGWGILGMAVAFALSYLFYYLRGLKNG